jgi:NADH pyrophosphatase NudC (nudix superfamily)
MIREISAGGVVVRPTEEGWQVAVIEPQKEPAAESSPAKKSKRSQKLLLALPKGLVDPGEKPEQTALREVREETGLTATLIAKLGDIKYVYVRSWGDQQRVGEISEEMRIEVKSAHWIPLEGATRQLAYSGEKDMVRRAEEYLKEHPEV